MKRFYQSSPTSPTFEGLPSEILEKFLLTLDIQSIKQLCQVNRRISEICSTETFWKRVLQRDYNIKEPIGTNSWKCFTQFLSIPIYVLTYVDTSDTTYEQHLYLNIEDCVESLIEKAEDNGDLLELVDLEQIRGISQDVIDGFVNTDLNELKDELYKNDDERRQFIQFISLVRTQIRENIIEGKNVYSGNSGNIIMNVRDDAFYNIQVHSIDLSQRKKSEEYEFIKILSEQDEVTHSSVIKRTLFELISTLVWRARNIPNSNIRITNNSVFISDGNFVEQYTPFEDSLRPEFIRLVRQTFPQLNLSQNT